MYNLGPPSSVGPQPSHLLLPLEPALYVLMCGNALICDIVNWQCMLCKPPLYANYKNSNLSHRINIQGEGAQRRVRGDLQKCDYPI